MTPFLQGTTRPTVDPALVWPFAHNWRSQASERLEWKTSIHTAHSGDEMRRSWRREPRLLAGFESQVVGQQAARAQAMLRGWAGKTWAVPIWWAASRLTLAAGSTLTLSRATDTLWPASGWGLLWRADDDCEIFEIDTVQADSLTPTAEPTGAWAAGDLVVPLHFATLDDAQSWSAVTGGVAVVKTDWSVLPGNGTVLREPENGDYWADMMAGATGTRGQLLLRRHDWSTEVSVTAETLTDIFDPGIGLLNRRPARSRPSLQWSVRDFLETDAALAQFRKFCAAHRGPAVGFHSACPVVDVTLLGIVGTAATLSGALDIIDDLAGTFTGLVFCDDAGIHTCQVTAFPSATAATLSAAVTVAGAIQWARPVSKARLAADAVEITHHALGLGVASYAVRTLPATSNDPADPNEVLRVWTVSASAPELWPTMMDFTIALQTVDIHDDIPGAAPVPVAAFGVEMRFQTSSGGLPEAGWFYTDSGRYQVSEFTNRALTQPLSFTLAGANPTTPRYSGGLRLSTRWVDEAGTALTSWVTW